MGSRLVQSETIYFVGHGSERSHEIEPNWFNEVGALLPRVYTGPDNRKEPPRFPTVIPIEVRTFEPS